MAGTHAVVKDLWGGEEREIRRERLRVIERVREIAGRGYNCMRMMWEEERVHRRKRPPRELMHLCVSLSFFLSFWMTSSFSSSYTLPCLRDLGCQSVFCLFLSIIHLILIRTVIIKALLHEPQIDIKRETKRKNWLLSAYLAEEQSAQKIGTTPANLQLVSSS